MLQENLSSKFDVCSHFKPNVPLAKVDEDVRKLGEDLTKQDHVVFVGKARNSLDINQYYSVQKDLTTAERTVIQMWDLSTSSGYMTNHG